MINLDVDVAVIGGGPAGLSAAISVSKNGVKNVLVLDRNNWLGGILPQCIHDGFGVIETGKSITGPEYAELLSNIAKKQKVKFLQETMVLQFNKNLEIIAVNRKGLYKIKAKAIILAMGCREKTRWNAMIPGERPSGIYTAGVAQAFINLYNIMVGKNVIILGSGDVGLIMARRLKLEGANVLGVVEILPYVSGLTRNIVQCLDDYDIPLFLNHTVVYIKGKERLESVTIAQIDEKMKIVSGTEKEIKCDTLLLSLGLIPENELSKNVGIEIDNVTGGPVVNQFFETSLSGVFSCGNCLQVYDTVDILSVDAKYAGKNAAKHVFFHEKEKSKYPKIIKILTGKGIKYVIPQRIIKPGKVHFTLRVDKPKEAAELIITAKNKEIFKKKLQWINPSNMVDFYVNITQDIIRTYENLEVFINE